MAIEILAVILLAEIYAIVGGLFWLNDELNGDPYDD